MPRMQKRPRDHRELRRVVHELAQIHRWSPGALDHELDAALIATIIHRFGATYVTPMRMKSIESMPVDAESQT